MSDSEKTLVLVDGSSYLFRAFHALPDLTTSSGEHTNAILGVCNMLKKLVDTYPDAHVGVVFDAPGKTFRHEMYPEYKANRPSMPDDLRQQIRPLHELIRVMGLPLIIESGVEADDVIGTLAKQAESQGYRVIISTGDKDLAQLVNERVSLINTMTNSWLDPQGVQEKFGVPPERIIDFLTLTGDSSDNIPGVPKVGPKTASKWLNEYGDLQSLIARSDEIKGKIGENLRASVDQIPQSRDLVTIRCDVPLHESTEDLKRQPADVEQLRAMLTRFEFKSWLKQFNEAGDAPVAVVAATPDQPAHYETILDSESFEAWVRRIEACALFALDTETTSLNYNQAEIVGLSFALETGRAAYLPVAHVYPGAPKQLSREQVLQRLKPILEAESPAKVGQNLKYDAHVLANHGIQLKGIRHDTMLESYVLDSTAVRHDMDSLAEHYLGHKTIHYEDVAGKGAKQIGFDQVPIEQAGPYAAEDAEVTWRLHEVLSQKLQALPSLQALYQDLEMPLLPVLTSMEAHGVLVDVAKLKRQSHELGLRLIELEKEAHAVAGQPFNLGSPKQIQEILYDQQQLPVLKKTPKGQPSTAEAVLQELALDYPLPRVILEHRSLNKLRSTYTEKLPEEVDSKTGRVHTSYHQAVAATGRLSSSDPNLQNIPVRTEEGRRIRQAFIAPEGCCLMAADYSQIELRIMAHLSQDAGLLRAFRDGLDVHRATAAEVFGIAPESVTSDQRRSAKAINFGLIYGMSAFGLGRQLGIERRAAQEYVDLYFARYPGVKAYMDRTRELAREQGYVETLFGRRLHLPEILSRNAQRRQYAERTAINAPMQGTAADIIKRAMLAVDDWLTKSGVAARMVMQVHDELVFEVEHGVLDEVRGQVSQLMSGAAKLDVPLLVEVGVGNNWDEAH